MLDNTKGFFAGGKAAGAWRWPILSGAGTKNVFFCTSPLIRGTSCHFNYISSEKKAKLLNSKLPAYMFGGVSQFLQCGILQATLTVAILHVYGEAILWVVTPCILVDICECFGGAFCVHLQNKRRHFDTLLLTCRGHILGDCNQHNRPFEGVKCL
jgi:hypothetical protein